MACSWFSCAILELMLRLVVVLVLKLDVVLVLDLGVVLAVGSLLLKPVFGGDFAFWHDVCSFVVGDGTDSVGSFVFGCVETGSFGGSFFLRVTSFQPSSFGFWARADFSFSALLMGWLGE